MVLDGDAESVRAERVYAAGAEIDVCNAADEPSGRGLLRVGDAAEADDGGRSDEATGREV